MRAVYNEEINISKIDIRDHLEKHPELEQDLFLQARSDALRAERSAITDAMQSDLISESVHEELVHAADHRLAALDLILETRREQTSSNEPSDQNKGKDTDDE
jgi:hypothetical protein